MFQKIVKACVYLLVFLMPLFWLPFSLEAYDMNKAYLLAFLVGIGILAWIGRMIFQDRKIIFKRTPLDFFVLGYLAVLILTVIFANDKISSLLGFYGRFWPSLLSVASLAGFYFLVTNNVVVGRGFKKQDDESGGEAEIKEENLQFISLKKLLHLFFFSCLIAAVVAYLSLFNVWVGLSGLLGFSLPVLMKTRIFNTIGSLQGLAVFLSGIEAMILVYLAFQSRYYESKAVSKKEKRGNKQAALWYILVFAILGILAVVNFWQAWFCLALSLVLFLILAFWKRMFKEDVQRLSLPIFILLLAIVFLFPNPLTQFLNQNSLISSLPKEAILPQNTSWSTNLQSLKENPVLGSGLGNFHYVFSKYKPASFLDTQFWQVRFDRSGNNIAETLGTTGILGILGFAVLFGMFFLISYLYIKSANREKTSGFQESTKRILAMPENPQAKPVSLFSRNIPILIGFTALLIAQFCYYQTAVLGFSFWLMLSLGVVSWGKGAKEKTYHFKDFPEAGLLLSIVFWVALLAFVFLAFTLLRYYLADVSYRQYLLSSGQNLAKLEKAAKSDSFGPTYHIALAGAYMQKFYDEASKAQPDKQVVTNAASLAINESRKAVALGPNRVASYEISGLIYRDIQGVAAGALDWAIKSFESALKLEPLNPVLITELGKLKLAAGDKEAAKQLFGKAVLMKKDYVEGSLQLVMLDEAEGKQSDALTKLENLVKNAPFSVEARFQLARVYFNSKDYDKASQQAEQALILFPNHSNSLFLLGLIYERMGKDNLALQAMEKVLELNPNNQQVKDEIAKLKQPPVIEQPQEKTEKKK
ncbi:MAG: tetratricopeptide repeat protein [Candidatus Pacebacteria bacterium]|nr:tetratricopeptide repeat protein [Candidatus Paceibacterota bacterium]